MQQLVTFGQVATSGSPEDRALAEGEARVFLEVLWAAATPAGRATFMKGMQGAQGPMPWPALTPQGEGAPMRAPVAMELILGAADLGEEGVDAYRIDALTAEGVRATAALRGWDLPVIAAITTPAGWHLERIDSPIGNLGVATKVDPGTTQAAEGEGTESGSQDASAEEEPKNEPTTEGTTEGTVLAKPSTWELPWWGWVALAGGGTLAAVGISYAMRGKE
ncbi:MAG: hypothetical protein R3B09_35630 [Nannocystaceae bacterium]